ncbi:MAG: 50S ribosomal protein L9 [Chitinophagaceae bacterium]|nr:50S ribosomal protein L9 [Chitinophagaceae bacterium]
MQVILIQDVNNLGGVNELVTVKNGYGRNYLIPSKMAIEASPSNMKMMEEKRNNRLKRSQVVGRIEQCDCCFKDGALKIGAKTGTSGKIFGSVTSVQIARAIKEQKGYEIDRRRISIIDEVKELGTYKAKIDFSNGNEAEVEFEVVAE